MEKNLLSEILPDTALLDWELGFLHPCSSIPRLARIHVSGNSVHCGSAALSKQTLILDSTEDRTPFDLTAPHLSQSYARPYPCLQLRITEVQTRRAQRCTITRLYKPNRSDEKIVYKRRSETGVSFLGSFFIHVFGFSGRM